MHAWTLYNPLHKRLVSVTIPVQTSGSEYYQPSYLKPAVLLFDRKPYAETFRRNYLHFVHNHKLSENTVNIRQVELQATKRKNVQSELYTAYPLDRFDNDKLVEECIAGHMVFLYVYTHSHAPPDRLTLNCMIVDPVSDPNTEFGETREVIINHLNKKLFN